MCDNGSRCAFRDLALRANWPPLQHLYPKGLKDPGEVPSAAPRMPMRFSLHEKQLPCPDNLMEFLLHENVMPQGNGLRVARIPRHRYHDMESSQRQQLLDQALRARIFIVIGGAFEQRMEELTPWLRARGKSVCQLSGRDDKAELSVELGAYLDKLEGYELGTSAWGGSLGTFTCKNQQLFKEDVEFLEADETLRHYLPWGSRSVLADTLEAEKSLQYGPYVFGGDKMRKHCEDAAMAAMTAACADYDARQALQKKHEEQNAVRQAGRVRGKQSASRSAAIKGKGGDVDADAERKCDEEQRLRQRQKLRQRQRQRERQAPHEQPHGDQRQFSSKKSPDQQRKKDKGPRGAAQVREAGSGSVDTGDDAEGEGAAVDATTVAEERGQPKGARPLRSALLRSTRSALPSPRRPNPPI